MVYPDKLHYVHNDYPLTQEALSVTGEWLSPYRCALVDDSGRKFVECSNLIPNLRPKINYVVHVRNLQLYLRFGLCVSRIHRALRFNQRAWMAPDIQINRDLIKAATNEFEKDLFNPMNNAVFGKTITNLRKRIRVDFVLNSDELKLHRSIADPSLESSKIFNGGLVAVHCKRSRLKLTKHIYVGASVLDLSTLLMSNIYYDSIKPRYGGNIKMPYTDIDSLLMHITTNDIYADMVATSLACEVDTSEYQKDHPLFSNINKKVMGKFRDACAGNLLRSTCDCGPK